MNGEASLLDRIVVGEAVAFPGYSSAVIVDDLIFLSGLRALNTSASSRKFDDLPAGIEIGQQEFWLADAAEEQVAIDGWNAHKALDHVLAAVGSANLKLLRLRIWQKDKRFFPAYERVRALRQPRPSPSSGHAADPLLGIGGRTIGLDGIAFATQQPEASTAEASAREATPARTYSTVARFKSYVFIAGLTPVKQQPGFPTVQSFDDVPVEGRRFATGRSHTDSRDGPIAAQTWYVYDKIRTSLEEIGGGLGDVVHCLVGLRDLRDVPMFHRAHREIFGDRGPALTVVGAGEVGHRASLLYIEPTAYLGGAASVGWSGPPPLSAPLARRAGKLIFLSGMLPIDDKGGKVSRIGDLKPACPPLVRTVSAWGHPAFAAQCWQVWCNLAEALERSGSSVDLLVKLTVFIADPATWPVFEMIRQAFIADHLPAIEAVVVPHPGPDAGFLIQIDAVAAFQ